ncbi:MAG: glutathione S-transferase [Robiginitomaculum sp.]|nr:glutathione S-transferase [Robiginitomaculum sp.]
MLKLYIGNKNYSSWSMRPWLVLKKSELPFEEKLILLDVPGFKAKLFKLSSAGTVPVLQVHGEMIPDSLAISEWAAKGVPNLWPKDAKDKQIAREFCKQMQDDFVNLRSEAPMNLRRRTRSKLPKSAVQDAARMQDIWLELLGKHDGPYLFNDWSIADAFSTPYASRFVSYGIDRNARADTYISELMSDDDFLEWEIAGLSETWKMPDTDAVNT